MNIFELVSMHMKAMRLPLYAVTVSMADQVNTPALLIMHWHGFRRVTPLTLPDVNLPARPVPDSVLQLDATWSRPEALDQPLLNAAWQFGAWDLERVEHKAWWRPGAPATEALACQRAFGCYAGAVDAACPVVTSAQTANDREVLLELAARRGYVRWLFRPRRGGIWATLADKDDSVDKTGGRTLPCPIKAAPRGAGAARTVYRLGRVDHLILSG